MKYWIVLLPAPGHELRPVVPFDLFFEWRMGN